MNATINLEKNHFPVLLNELISIISPLYGGTFIDCTLGQGGYSKEILKTKSNNVIALDRDPDVSQIAKKIEKQNKNRFTFFNSKFCIHKQECYTKLHQWYFFNILWYF